MKQKRQKHAEMRFTSYLDKDEYLIWVGEPQDNRMIRARKLSCIETLSGFLLLMISAAIMIILAFNSPNYTWIPLLGFLLSLGFLLEFSRTYYAISNKRLFILNLHLSKHLHTEDLTHLQKLSIAEDEKKYFSLNLAPLGLVYGVNHGIKQDYRIEFSAKRLEGLSQEDAQTAYDLLMAEREERAEELDWVE